MSKVRTEMFTFSEEVVVVDSIGRYDSLFKKSVVDQKIEGKKMHSYNDNSYRMDSETDRSDHRI